MAIDAVSVNTAMNAEIRNIETPPAICAKI